MIKPFGAVLLAIVTFGSAGMAFAQSPSGNTAPPMSQAEWNTENEIAHLTSEIAVLTNEVSDLQAHDPQAEGSETFSNDDAFTEEPIASGD